MRAGERLVGNDGKEVMLFPLTHLYITQGEYETYSHDGILAMDFVEWSNNGQVTTAPLYAPCSCRCVATIDVNNNGRVFQSIDQVHTPRGLEYVTFMCFHDNNPIASIGSTFTQGSVFAHTGTAGYVSGDHTHFNTANGTYAGWENVPPRGYGQLINSEHIYDICYVNDTTLVNTYGYNWVTYSGGHPPTPSYGNSKFPWVLYARKFRNRQRYI